MNHTACWRILAVLGTLALSAPAIGDDDMSGGDGRPDNAVITLIHIGDLHGHMVPRPNAMIDNREGATLGGLARMYSVIKKLRDADRNAILFNTGDTVQGSAEVLYTRGQAIIDVLNHFAIDAFAPGNWDYVYGTQRFLELWGGNHPIAPWNGLAANLYYSTLQQDPTTPYPATAGQRVLPPYMIRTVNGVRIGILGFTNNRGPQVVGTTVMKGFQLTNGDAEAAQLVPYLRNVEKCDLVVMISELGLAHNTLIAERVPGIDVIMSSDMHEQTWKADVTKTGTIVVEEGNDGMMMGAIKLHMKNGHVKEWKWTPYKLDAEVKEDQEIAALVREARKTFVSGPDFVQHVNPINGTKLQRPVDTVVGYTTIQLQRMNFSDQDMPAVIEGTSSDFLTDAFRYMTGAQIGALRGFRYGTVVQPGPITMEDLYHFVPIGPQIAIGNIKGQALKNQIENAADGSLNPDPIQWSGGWLFNFSGVTMDLDPYQTKGNRASNIRVDGVPLDVTKTYTYASYWYARDPGLINVLPASNIQILKDDNGDALDGTEVVARYLQRTGPANPQLERIRLLRPLPAPVFGNREIQPLRGAQ